MSEPLTREQVERACIGLLNDAAIKGQIGLTTTLVLLSAHDAALRQQLATAQARIAELKVALEACTEGFSRPEGSSLLVRSQVYALLAKLKEEAI